MRQWLVHTVSVLEPGTTADAYGAPTGTERIVETIPARVVPVSARERLQFQALGSEVRHVVYCMPRAVAIEQGQVLRFGERRLKVVAYDNPDELGKYWRLYCEER